MFSPMLRGILPSFLNCRYATLLLRRLSGQFVGGSDYAVVDSQRTREVAAPTMDLLVSLQQLHRVFRAQKIGMRYFDLVTRIEQVQPKVSPSHLTVVQGKCHSGYTSRFSKEVEGEGTPKVASFSRFLRVRP
jgi:hypothetical protein